MNTTKHNISIKTVKLAIIGLIAMLIVVVISSLDYSIMGNDLEEEAVMNKFKKIDGSKNTIKDANLSLGNLALTGYNNSNPYNLKAESAEKTIDGKYDIDNINGWYRLNDNMNLEFASGNGCYDETQKIMLINEHIQMKLNDYQVHLKDIELDLGKTSLKSNSKVIISNRKGNIEAQSLNTQDGGNKIILDGNVKVNIDISR